VPNGRVPGGERAAMAAGRLGVATAKSKRATKARHMVAEKQKGTVRVGQTWCDNDKRMGRELRVIGARAGIAHCEVRARGSNEVPRFTKIAVDRFRPISTGYTLLLHADAAEMIEHVETCRDMLGEVMEAAPSENVVMGWSPGEREEAMDWAAAEMLNASDHQVRRKKRPEFMGPEPL